MQGRKPQIKICGLTTEEEVRWVLEEEVDYLGMVLFFPKSKRNLSIEQAKRLLYVCHHADLYQKKKIPQTVAVTVSPTPEQTRQIEQAGFDMIQIHGELTPETYEAVNLPIIRAYQEDIQLPRIKQGQQDKIVAYLYDAKEPGSGKTFDWDKLADVSRGEKLLILAGGLHAGNVAAAIAKVHPDVVDVSSGVETEREKIGKDRAKIKEFVRKVETNE